MKDLEGPAEYGEDESGDIEFSEYAGGPVRARKMGRTPKHVSLVISGALPSHARVRRVAADGMPEDSV